MGAHMRSIRLPDLLIEIRIPNPFEEDRDWVVPVQVKDYEGFEPQRCEKLL